MVCVSVYNGLCEAVPCIFVGCCNMNDTELTVFKNYVSHIKEKSTKALKKKYKTQGNLTNAHTHMQMECENQAQYGRNKACDNGKNESK